MRPNVVFHDGTPCDGAALVTNLEAQSKSLLTGLVLSPTLQSITQTGPLSADHLLQDRPGCRSPTTWPAASAARSPTSWRRPCCANPNGTSNPVGTGPFVFKEWVPNDHFTATANPTTGGRACPTCREITFKPIPDE